MIDQWRAGVIDHKRARPLTARTKNRSLMVLNGIFKRAQLDLP